MKNIKSPQERRLLKSRKRIAITFSVVIGCFLFYGAFYEITVVLKNKNIVAEQDRTYLNANLFQNNLVAREDSFVADVRNGINDKYTKMSAYFITRRYIDNGGNIYEIYDYVESHPELAFLKEAENIFPEAFERIKNKRLPFTYSDSGMYAYLAYVEILERYGYVDVAALGTAANQYSMMAYYKRMIREDKLKGVSLDYPDYTENDVESDINKAVFFAEKANDEIAKILDNQITSEDVPPLDILFGVNQYASALRYLDALGTPFSSLKTSQEAFFFATDYSYRFVPEMYLVTSLSNAVTLLLAESSTAGEIKNAIYPFFDLQLATDKSNGIVDKIIQARLVKASVSRYSDLSIYSRGNIVAIANRVPEFRVWLTSNGWEDKDFK